MSIRPVDHGVMAGQGGIADVVAYGGMINQYVDDVSGNTYRTHTFRGKGGWLEVISNPLDRTADILIVAGGGNAIGDYAAIGSGGGGAGGVRLITGEAMTTGIKTMVVGRGGVRYSAAYAGNSGSDTWYTGWTSPYPTADGGGGGQVNNGIDGGSGGGGSKGGSGGSGNVSGVSPAEGNDGGDGYTTGGGQGTGGGGGGFGGAGADGSGSRGGNGGDGGWSIGWTKASHAGTSSNGVRYGGGGGGCERDGTTHGNAGSGGGGWGGKPGSTSGWGESGCPNTGGGAGASTDTFIGSSGGLTTDAQFTGGGSGIIIVRYQVTEAV